MLLSSLCLHRGEVDVLYSCASQIRIRGGEVRLTKYIDELIALMWCVDTKFEIFYCRL